MKRALRLLGPPVLAVALAWAAGPLYARVLAWAAEVSRSVVPPAKAPAAVRVEGTVVRVFTETTAERIPVGAIAWDLPVLLCLWAWVVRGRWGFLLGAAAGFVLLHAFVLDVRVRVAMGGASGWPYSVMRAWAVFGAMFLPVACVALAWATDRRRRSCVGAAFGQRSTPR